jgi:hypothetical protein
MISAEGRYSVRGSQGLHRSGTPSVTSASSKTPLKPAAKRKQTYQGHCPECHKDFGNVQRHFWPAHGNKELSEEQLKELPAILRQCRCGRLCHKELKQPCDCEETTPAASSGSLQSGRYLTTMPDLTPFQSMNSGASFQFSLQPANGSSTSNSFAAVSLELTGNLPATIQSSVPSNRRQGGLLRKEQKSPGSGVPDIRLSGGSASRMHPISPPTSLPKRVGQPPRYRPEGSLSTFSMSHLRQRLTPDFVDDSNQYLAPPQGGHQSLKYAPTATQSYPKIQGACSVPPLPPDPQFLRFERSIPANPYAFYPVSQASQHPTGKCSHSYQSQATHYSEYPYSSHAKPPAPRNPPIPGYPTGKYCNVEIQISHRS